MTEGPVKVGDALNFGRFRIHLRMPPPGADLLLEVEEHLSARQVEAARKARVRLSLADSTLRKRGWAWGLALTVLVLLFALPVALRYGIAGEAGVSLDRAWQAGPPSDAHSGFVEDCDSCHQAPFAAVRNDACLACHKRTAHHSDQPQILEQGGMTEARCGSCHLEHTGRNTLIARNTALCTDCHADLAGRFPDAQLAPVGSFDRDHPGFTLSLPAWQDGEAARVELEQGPAVREDSRLTFPHDAHLAADGVSSPDGKRVLECADCHRPMGTSFAPIRMEEHCQSCHRLDFDPAYPEATVPHAEASTVLRRLVEYYSRTFLELYPDPNATAAPARPARVPGRVTDARERARLLQQARERAFAVARDLFERRTCHDCHEIAATGNADDPWKVEPAKLRTAWMPGARFNHGRHATALSECDLCHDAAKSKDASDVLMPRIEDCRECHGSGDPHRNPQGRVQSGCTMCHGFHDARHGAWEGAAR